MKIVFCGKCGVRLSDQDYPGGLDAAPADADMHCRECSTPTTVQLPVAGRDRSSESRLKPVRKASASSTQPGIARKSGIQTAPPEEAFAAASGRERKKLDSAPAPKPSLALPIAGAIMALLAVLVLFLITRGSPETPKENVRTAAASAQRQNETPVPPPASTAATPSTSKIQAPQKPDPAQSKAAQKTERTPVRAGPPVAPSPAPVPANSESQKTVEQAQTPNTTKGLETAKVSSLPDSEEEESITTEKKPANPSANKTVDKETAEIGLFKPQAGETPPPGPAPKVSEPEKKNADVEQRLKRGEWVSLFTKDDHANWKLEKPDCWKLQGDSLAGSGKLQYNGINLTNYEMKAEVSLQKGASLSFVLRSNDDIAYRIQVGDKAVAGQLWDYKQKKVKKPFERVELDTKAYLKLLVQSKGRYLRVVLNDKEVLLEYDEVPMDTTGFYFNTNNSKGALKNISLRALY